LIELQPWVEAILAHPITKQPCKPEAFKSAQGVIDARVFLKNTHGYSDWAEGQDIYENVFSGDTTTIENYQTEINRDRPIYQHYKMAGRILDCGGGGR
jgi:hypothetical protein